MFKFFRLFSVADLFQIGGALIVSIGCFILSVALGFIIAGIFLLLFGIAVAEG